MRLLTLLAVLGLAGCSAQPASELLIGEWSADPKATPRLSIEFTRDGKMRTLVNGQPAVEAKYRLESDNKVELEYADPAGGQAKKFTPTIESLSREKLILVDKEGQRQVLRRVPRR